MAGYVRPPTVTFVNAIGAPSPVNLPIPSSIRPSSTPGIVILSAWSCRLTPLWKRQSPGKSLDPARTHVDRFQRPASVEGAAAYPFVRARFVRHQMVFDRVHRRDRRRLDVPDADAQGAWGADGQPACRGSGV